MSVRSSVAIYISFCRLIFVIFREFCEPISISDISFCFHYILHLFSHFFSLALLKSPFPPSLPLTSTTHTNNAIWALYHDGWNMGYRERVWGARRGKGDPCYQVVVACSYNSHRVIRLKWCSRRGFKHHEKPISYISRPK